MIGVWWFSCICVIILGNYFKFVIIIFLFSVIFKKLYIDFVNVDFWLNSYSKVILCFLFGFWFEFVINVVLVVGYNNR